MEKKLNLGSGTDYREGFINLDIDDKNIYGNGIKVDVKHDITKFPYPFKKDTFEYVSINDVLEHIEYRYLKNLFKEIYRICKSNAIIDIKVPYFSNYIFFRDPTHTTPFTSETISLLIDKNDLEIIENRIIISRNKVLKVLNFIVNKNNLSKKIYERFFCYYIPANYLFIKLKKK